MVACTQGIGTACAKCEARSSQSDSAKAIQANQLHLCIAQLPSKFAQPFMQSRNFATKISILSFFFSFSAAITRQRKLTKIPKNHHNSSFYTRMCLLILRHQVTSLAMAANYAPSDKRSIHDAIFIQQLTTLMTVQSTQQEYHNSV